MDKKNKSSTTTIKQTFSYGKSKTVTVEIIKKKDSSNEYNTFWRRLDSFVWIVSQVI